jgi:hypothetical protein
MHRSILKQALVVALLAVASVSFMNSVASARAPDASSEGCLQKWLFNGIWRVRATKVEPLMDGSQQVGWQVTEEWRNGTSQEIAPGDSLMKDQVLQLEDGTSIAASASNTGVLSMTGVSSHAFAPAAQFTYLQLFRTAGLKPAVKPKALTITFDGARLAQFKSRPQFTTARYNFRIKLDCKASGEQAAQGGSYQIAGTQGCVNQWMSNGVWRVRATAIGPDNNGGGPQIGWMITEDWASLVNRPLAPGDTNVTDQQLVLASGNTIASSNSAGTQMNWMQLTTRTFAPRSLFTYQQRFRMSSFNASDKPVKLIVTFDANKEKLFTHMPQYKVIPPNFRIGLTCSK